MERRSIRWLAIVVLAIAMASTRGVAQEHPAPPGDAAVQVYFGPQDGPDGGHFQPIIEPGASQQLTVVIGNYGQQELALRTTAGNAYTAVNGGFALSAEDDPLVAPATWLDYPAETITLGPGEAMERTFTVSVPVDAAAGWYLAGIAVQNADPIAMGDGGLSQVIRKVSGVSILVPGEITPGAALGTPTVTTASNGSTLVIPIENTGNIRLTPIGELSLRDGTGEAVLTAPVAMRPIYAGHATTIEISLPLQVPPGDYVLDLQLTDADGTGWSGALDAHLVTVPALAEATPDQALVEITAASVVPVPEATSGDPPQYATVTIEVTNRSAPVPSSRLTLVALRDGEIVEEFVLAQSLNLVEPVTTVEQRYIPVNGWEGGTWSFQVELEAVDPNTGVEAVLAMAEIPETIVVAP
jgi:hypothetical protein